MLERLIKYGSVTISSYFIIIIGTYVLVEYLKMSPNLAYFIIISLIYIAAYIAYTKFVFTAEINKKTITKYIIALLIFWLLNNIFYNFMLEIFNVQYLLAAIINIISLGAIRFFVYKNLVFKT